MQFQSVELSQPVDAFIDMAVSFNNKYIALFTESGMVWIGSADLTVSLLTWLFHSTTNT